MATITVTATCACKSFTLPITYPISDLPFSRSLCLCNSCRRLSGSCGNTYIILPSSLQKHDLPSDAKLTAYKTSDRVTRYFCERCGAHVLIKINELEKWFIATGILDRTEGIVRWEGCKWVEGTLDGGASDWLRVAIDPDGQKRELRRWMFQDGPDGKLVPEDWKTDIGKKESADDGEERLHAKCHCGGVDFYVTRPNAASKEAHSTFPDLMVPFHTGPPSANPQNEPWWLRCKDTKYLAGTCTCTSCRLSLGFEIQTWAFIPQTNLFWPDGLVMEWGVQRGTMRKYESSPEVWRTFCGVCGATVFWNAEWRAELVDVSVGLLDPEEGARVEGWLEWFTERVSFEEMAVSRGLVEGLKDGLKKWGDERKDE